MTLLVAGILLGVGVPNVMEFQRNGAMTAAANDFVTGVLMARTEAVKRQAFVTICLSDNPTDAEPDLRNRTRVADSTRGFIVWVDENDNFDANGARILTDGSDGDAVVDVAASSCSCRVRGPAARSKFQRTAVTCPSHRPGSHEPFRASALRTRAPCSSATIAAAASPPARSRAHASSASIYPGAVKCCKSSPPSRPRSPGHWPASRLRVHEDSPGTLRCKHRRDNNMRASD